MRNEHFLQTIWKPIIHQLKGQGKRCREKKHLTYKRRIPIKRRRLRGLCLWMCKKLHFITNHMEWTPNYIIRIKWDKHRWKLRTSKIPITSQSRIIFTKLKHNNWNCQRLTVNSKDFNHQRTQRKENRNKRRIINNQKTVLKTS